MIAGFIIGGGNGMADILVRAIGPSLTQTGIAAALADPVQSLYDPQGTLIVSNDDWQTSGDAEEIRATTIPPTDQRESAIFKRLPSGAYTAIMRGKFDTTGVGVIEVYHFQ